MESVPFDLIISDATQIKLCVKIEKFHPTVKIRVGDKTDTLNLQFEPGIGRDTDDDYTSDSDNEDVIGEEMGKEDHTGLLPTINEKEDEVTAKNEDHIVHKQLRHFEDECAQRIKTLLSEYLDVIVASFYAFRPSNVKYEHKFELTSDQPIFQKLGRVPPNYSEIVMIEVDRMLDAGIVTRIESSWKFPVVIMNKKDDSPKFCVKYCRPNAVMKRVRWTMPHVDEIVQEISGSKIFTAIELFPGYCQI